MDFRALICLAFLLTFTDAYSLSSCPNEHPQTKNGYLDSLHRILQIKAEAEVISKLIGARHCSGEIGRPSLDGETFQFQNVTERNVLVFSAYHETRTNAGGPALRIISNGWQRAYRDVGDLYCTLWYKDRKKGISVGPAEYVNIFPSTAHHDMWCAHFILCPLPPEVALVPYAVSITHAPCALAKNALFVANRDVTHKKGKHAVCYPVLHNRFKDWNMLVEFFEFQRLLGAEEITIYNLSVSVEVSRTLQYFQRLGWLTVIPWPFPGYLSQYFFQRTAINECIYRHMHRYDYVAVLDLDELFIPRLSTSWPHLLNVIGRPKIGVYMFQHYYFRRNNSVALRPEDLYSKQSMITLSSFYRTHQVTPPGKIRCKSMYKTDMVLKGDVHFPYQLVPGAKEYLVDPDEGALHHYRITPFQSFIKNPEKYTFIEDKYVEIFAKKLQRLYHEHLNNLVKLLHLL